VSVLPSHKSRRKLVPPAPWAPGCYRFVRRLCQIPFLFCVKPVLINAEVLDGGGCVLACTHMGHLEAACVSVLVRRRIDWMVRTELFHSALGAWILRALDAIPLQRYGVPVRALRTAIARAKAGRAVGMFPEGRVAIGPDSVCHGGAIRPGVCFISIVAQVPIVPVVVVGAEQLHNWRAWTPFRGSRLWVILGRPLMPPAYTPGLAAAASRREQRAELSAELQHRFVKLYAELRARHPVDEMSSPKNSGHLPVLHER